jgi:alpha-L-fucosidase
MALPKSLPRIEKFENLAYGMFIHWGLYSQLGRGEWVKCLENIDMTEYAKLKNSFYANEFDGRAIARFAKEAGMKYTCLTTRHHEGFSLYNTKGLTDFDSMHSPAGRDLASEFVEGCREESIVPFFYHTTLDWYQESFKNNFKEYIDFLCASIEILCRNYGKVGGFWFDGNWSKPDADWQESRLYGIIRKYQPDAIIVNNTGLYAKGAVGHPEIDCVTFEQGRPEPMNREGMEKYLSGEMCQTINMHWGVCTDDFGYMSPKEIIENLCACRKVGANYLLNVGLTAAGRIPDYEVATLCRAGSWVNRFERIIRKARPCGVKGAGSDFVLELDGNFYLFIHNLAVSGDDNVVTAKVKISPRIFTGLTSTVTQARWLDNDEKLKFAQNSDSGLFCLNATPYPYGTNLVVRVAEVFKQAY